VTKLWGWENWESRGFHSEIERENESRGISSAGRFQKAGLTFAANFLCAKYS
jgi:hypothetical protein